MPHARDVVGTKPVAFLCAFAVTLMAALVLVTGCLLSPAEPPTPTPTKTPRPTPTETPTATVTPRPPTPTVAAASARPTIQVATPTPLPGLLPDVCPLSGEKAEDVAILERRPLAIKVANGPAARPQKGLSQADIVYEHLAEGRITRFTALFHCHEPESVGSIRSARLIDLEIPIMYQAVFAFSGAHPEVTKRLKESDYGEMMLTDWDADPGFYRDETIDKAYEHTLFVHPKELWAEAERRGWNKNVGFRGLFFSEEPPTGGEPATFIRILYHKKYGDVRYEYDAEQGRYMRSMGDEPFIDAATGEQIGVRNVIVVWANHVETEIIEDSLGSHSIQIQLWGDGPAKVFRDGQVFEGKWVRRQRPDPISFVDGQNEDIPLKPGNTWIEVVPLEMEIEVE